MRAAKVVSFTLILVTVLIWVNNIIMYKSPYGITQYEAFYEQERGSIDVLFVGTSHVYSDINPAYVFDECGVLSYDLATGGAPISASYYSIEQAFDYQHPDVVALELFGIMGWTLEQREIIDATYGIRNPKIKYASLREHIGDNSLLDFYMAFPWYHSLYNSVDRSDFNGYDYIQNVGTKVYLYFPKKLQSYKGATILSNITPGKALDISRIKSEYKIDETTEIYLNKIMRLCKEKNIELCFIVSPFFGISEKFCGQINYVRNNIAAPNNIKLIDSTKYMQDIGIDWSTDAAEYSHLNYKGAEKYSRWLSRQLTDLYGLQDSHGKAVAESWEQNLEWEQEVYQVFKLLETYRIEDNIDIWNKLNADIFVSFNGEQWKAYKEFFLHLIEINEEKGKVVDGLIMIDGEWKIHYYNDEEVIIEEGINTFSLNSSEQGAVINYNGSDLMKESNGINIVVYDKYIGDKVDCVAFTNINELNCVR